MDEEKTIDEAVEEKADEMKEFEPVAFDEVIKDEPAKETAPVLRDGGDPEPADMNMIHKHLDNFLAMLCGETPIDDNVRTSTEYWLKRLAKNLPGGGGVTRDVLYTNPSPTVAQGQTSLTLSKDATKYDAIEVHFAENASYDGEDIAIFNVYGTSPGVTLYSGSGTAFSIRTGYFSNPTTLFMKVNYLWNLSDNTSSQYNSGNVIRKVVGIKY